MTGQFSLRTGKKLFGGDPNDRGAPIEHIPEYSFFDFPKNEIDRIVRREVAHVALEFRGRLLEFNGLGDGRYTVDYGDAPKAPAGIAPEVTPSPTGVAGSVVADDAAHLKYRAKPGGKLLWTVALTSAALSLASLGIQLVSDSKRKIEEARMREIARDLTERIDQLTIVLGKKAPPEVSNVAALQSALTSLSNRVGALERGKSAGASAPTKAPNRTGKE